MAVYNVNWIKEVGKESRNWGGGCYFLFFGRQEEWTSEMEEEEKVKVVRGKRVGRGMKVEIVFWEIRKHH